MLLHTPPPTNSAYQAGPHDVQIEILYCGVCHSDLAQINNEWFPGVFPMIPGHEIVGRVINVDSHVKNLKSGTWREPARLLTLAGNAVTPQKG